MTTSISTKWIVEMYPFDSPVPSSSDFSPESIPTALKKVSVATNSIRSGDVFKTLAAELGFGQDEVLLKTTGITSVSITRSKSSPDGQATLQIVGPLPEEMIPGSWVVISTASIKKGKPSNLIRFIGQIYAIDVNYVVGEDALKTTESRVSIREWSFALRVPVKYDILSLEASVSAPALSEKIISATLESSTNPATEIANVMTKAFNPFELASIVLQMIGCMNSEDIFGAAKKYAGIKLPDLALKMPSVPPGLLKRLNTGANPKNPFNTGFLKVITGPTLTSTNNNGWDGIWNSPSINNYAKILYQSATANQYVYPKTMGVAAQVQAGIPAWNILTQSCESTLNEVFTDIWYEEVTTTEFFKTTTKTIAKPVLVVRDRPFMLKMLRDNPRPELSNGSLPPGIINGYTLYDNIPRVSIPTEQIKNFRINNNVVNSPNYIRTEYTDFLGDRTTGAKGALGGITRLTPEMERFGGYETTAHAQFIGPNLSRSENSGASTINSLPGAGDTYFTLLRNLYTMWHSFDYRMANGVIMLKDDNLPISVGLNVQFKIGNHNLVGHVENVEYMYNVAATGLEETTTFVTLSRICKVEDDNSLGFINPTDFGNLYYAEPKAGTVGIPTNNLIAAAASAIKNFLA